MQVAISSTSSIIDDNLVLIETSTTIGESTTTQKVGYDKTELMDNRYLSGTFEERVEALRVAAENMTERNVRLHFEALAKIASPEPVVVDVNAPAEVVAEPEPEVPVKKPRKARTPKAKPAAEQTEATEQE